MVSVAEFWGLWLILYLRNEEIGRMKGANDWLRMSSEEKPLTKIRLGYWPVFLLLASTAAGQDAITIYNLNGDTLLDNNKYSNVQAAVDACPAAGCVVRVPTGTWPPGLPNAALLINRSNVNIQCSGMGVSFISYTGTAAIPAVIDLGSSTDENSQHVNDRINNCTISGNANAQYAIRTRAVMRSDFSHNSLINVTVAGIQTNWAVVLTLDDLHTSFNEQRFTVTPQSCIILDGPDLNHKTTNTSVGQPVCEGVSGTGIVLNYTNNVTVHGGTSEQNNKGITLSTGAASDIVTGIDLEANTVANIEDGGYQNTFVDKTGNGLEHVLSTAVFSHWMGYTFDSIQIDSGAVETNLDHVGYNNSGSGSLTDYGFLTSKIRVLNLGGGVYDPDSFPGANGISINQQPPLTTSNQSGTGSICMTTSCSMTTPTISSPILTAPAIGGGGPISSSGAGGVLLGMVGGSNAGVQTRRGVPGCTTAASFGGFCSTAITVTWGTPFADADYTVVCVPSGGPTNYPSSPFITAKTASSLTVNYFAMTAGAASWSTIDCVAVHD